MHSPLPWEWHIWESQYIILIAIWKDILEHVNKTSSFGCVWKVPSLSSLNDFLACSAISLAEGMGDLALRGLRRFWVWYCRNTTSWGSEGVGVGVYRTINEKTTKIRTIALGWLKYLKDRSFQIMISKILISPFKTEILLKYIKSLVFSIISRNEMSEKKKTP